MGKVNTIKDIFENNNELSKEIIESKKPMIVFGESFFKIKSASHLFYLSKKFLSKNNKLNDDWNPINILSVDAATVGNLDLDIIDKNDKILDELHENIFEIIFLLGQDNLDFKKKDEFIIYQGSHGDRGAEIADIILPGAAYTEQSGHYTNLEGKLQKAYKASYPPGDAKEDWQIINDLAEVMNNRKLFNDKDELESSMFNYLKMNKDQQTSELDYELNESDFTDEFLKVDYKDYYFSNVIARSSKTMLECNNAKIDLKKTGTEG
jgi:NADH dehydrogenase/NADH:ubiquinone oxidoreductase 75 kD subunit (chain G)